MNACRQLLPLLGLALAGCDNMQHQPGRVQAGDDIAPPPGAVARAAPYARTEPAIAESVAAGLARSPLPFSAERLARGRERFGIYCAPCHGDDGYGGGIIVRRGFPAPPSYHEDRLRAVADGHLYDVISRGFGVMPAFADRIASADRWAIVGYVRALQRSQHATLADVPESIRPSLQP